MKHISIVLVFGTYLYANSFGYLRPVEASFCMDDCSQYMLEDENYDFITFVANINEIDLFRMVHAATKISLN